MIDSRKLPHELIVNFECPMLLSFHKGAPIDCVIEDRWVVAKRLGLQLHPCIKFSEGLQKSRFGCERGYIPINCSQTAFMENRPRLV